MRILFLILFFVACNAQVEPEIAGSSEGSGGTEVVGNEVQDGPSSPKPGGAMGTGYNQSSTTYRPHYKTYQEVSEQEYRILLKHPNKYIHLNEIHLPNRNVISSSEAALFDGYTEFYRAFSPAEQTVIEFTLDRKASIDEIDFYFSLSDIATKPESIWIEANIAGNWVKVYEALYQTDKRADFYLNKGITKFKLKKINCPSGLQPNQLSECVAPIIFCTDIQDSFEQFNSKGCSLKRDSQEVYCLGVKEEKYCTDLKNTACTQLSRLVEFNNQMFEALFDGKSLGTFQCPKQ